MSAAQAAAAPEIAAPAADGPVDATPVDATLVDATPVDALPVDALPARVLIVSHSSQIAGAELVMLDLVRGFGTGSTAFLFADGPLRQALAAQNLPVVVSRRAHDFSAIKRDQSLARVLPHALSLVTTAVELAVHARRHRIVYANSQKAFILAAPAAAAARRPLVWHLHDILSAAHFGRGQRRLAVTLANRFAARVIVPSTAAAAAFSEAGGDTRLVHVVPNGLDVAPDATRIAALRAALGLPDGFLFGVFSRLAPWKGQHIALQALARLPQARCVIAGGALFGEDAYARSLHNMAVKLGVANRVLFLGHRDDVSRIMRAMDAVVHPSVDPEPFGRTLVEAMLCRALVIATDTGAAPEILDDGRAGLLVAAGDVQALTASLRWAMTRDRGIGDMLDRAETRARRLYAAPRMIAAVRAVIAPLVSSEA